MHLSQEVIQELVDNFHDLDLNDDGLVDIEEFGSFIVRWFPGISPECVTAVRESVFENGDVNKDGKIDFNEFINYVIDQRDAKEADVPHVDHEEGDPQHMALVNAIMRNLGADEVDMLRDAFIHMDMNSDGFLSLGEIFYVVRSVVGEEVFGPLAEYLEPIFIVADKDKDGLLSLTEFLASFADGPGAVPTEVINSCVSSIRVRLTDEEIYALQERFRAIDQNQDGFIDRTELLVALKRVLSMKFSTLSENTFNDIVNVVMASADADNDGMLSLSEFIRSFQEDQGVLPAAFIDVRAQAVARQLTQREISVLKETFSALDKKSDGFNDYIELYQALWDALQHSVDNRAQVRDLCDLIMATSDRNKDGKLTLTDFIRNFINNTDNLQITLGTEQTTNEQQSIERCADRIKEVFSSGQVEKLLGIFKYLDVFSNGYLEQNQLEGLLINVLREKFPEISDTVLVEVLGTIISSADTDDFGRLSISGFIQTLDEGIVTSPTDIIQENNQKSLVGDDRDVGHDEEEKEVTTQRDLTEYELIKVVETFQSIKTNENGRIGRVELITALEQNLSDVNVDKDTIALVIRIVLGGVYIADDDTVSFTEFLASVQGDEHKGDGLRDHAEGPNETTRAKTPRNQMIDIDYEDARSPIVNDVSGCAITNEQLRKEFRKYDVNGDGSLDRNEFKIAYKNMEHYGLVPTQAEIDRLFCKFGAADSRVSFDEFCIILLNRSKM